MNPQKMLPDCTSTLQSTAWDGLKYIVLSQHQGGRLTVIVRQLADIQNSDNDVHAETWNSRRLILANDRVGFSLHDTVMKAGTETKMWYKNHVEAVYVIEGQGELEDLVNNQKHPLSPGTLYLLNGHEQHIVRPKTDLRMVCVFNPPVTGRETHDAEGAYPLLVD